MPDIRVRNETDLLVLAPLLRRVQQAHGYPINFPADVAGWLTPDGQVGSWVAFHQGRVVGHLSLTAATGTSETTLWVERLFVDPGAGGHGIGTGLLRFAEDEAARRALPLRLEVADNCTAAIALYRRLGWTSYAQVPINWGQDLATQLILFRPPPLPHPNAAV